MGILIYRKRRGSQILEARQPSNHTRHVCSPHRTKRTVNQDRLAPERRDKKQKSPSSVSSPVEPHFPCYEGKEKSKRPKLDTLALGLKPQSELPPSPVLTHSVQKPRNGFLLRETSAVEMFTDNKRELVFAHAVLAGGAAQRGVGDGDGDGVRRGIGSVEVRVRVILG